MKIDYTFQGVSDKLSVATDLIRTLNINMSDVAYIGDDIGDLLLLAAVGISGAPVNAPDYVKKKFILLLVQKVVKVYSVNLWKQS